MPFGDGLSNPYRWSQGGFGTFLFFFGFLYTYCMPGKNAMSHKNKWWNMVMMMIPWGQLGYDKCEMRRLFAITNNNLLISE